ncbi:MAG: bifunctional UDP-3-O-[3-hydroxymyristoyl] N-acetylglucosamine deacetylase/3-hydroxyacyl-ACP dehydratase [Candidatus Omnitrophica bacterium]|nr:bifunctional UDP-3-O-[3-hydroxymyristoyl] N-acetylglucosamine deacetylase/3-hydroxyacyl-ACP dehydratase [Candidatus Omnitrophota bacterium]MCG2702838.1 bifunctional UDP-3-O-[3-hydroxymyristoyl] N-acetylglucosamine deacetylase/3-hydroxyacyl-ACP dehydratase [Candidatus Omnitrophota bacterium]
MAENQRTITSTVELGGVGLHTGQKVNVKFKPAQENQGVEFVRVDLKDKPRVKAHISNLIERPRRTSIGIQKVEIHTIEHVLAALVGLGIDNITIELDAEELPGLDGSALPFLEILKRAGVKEQNSPRSYFQPKEPLYMEEGDSSLMILPANDFRVSYTMSYPHPMLKSQYASFDFDSQVFEKEIAPSRTFCLQQEAEDLTRQGLGKGANYENTIVVGVKGIVNNTLRFEDEFVRHKICDLIGDLYLLGHPLKGHVVGIKSGHPLNIKLLQKIKHLHDRQTKAGIAANSNDFNNAAPLDINDIKRILPHRYPFLLVDRIIQLKEDSYAVGIKNVSVNEQFFEGHFPGRPVMPGVLIVEAMAQTAGVLILSKRANLGKRAYFMSIDKVKFRRIVFPGDQLRIEVSVLKLKSKIGQVYARAIVEDKLVAEATLLFSLGER